MRFVPIALTLLVAAGTACNAKKPGGLVSSLGEAPLPSAAVVVSGAAAAVPREPEKASIEPAKNGPLSFAPIAKLADPSVVTVQTIGEEIEPSPFF